MIYGRTRVNQHEESQLTLDGNNDSIHDSCSSLSGTSRMSGEVSRAQTLFHGSNWSYDGRERGVTVFSHAAEIGENKHCFRFVFQEFEERIQAESDFR